MNNPLRHVDPTGEDWWNPFEVLGAALNAVGQALSEDQPNSTSSTWMAAFFDLIR